MVTVPSMTAGVKGARRPAKLEEAFESLKVKEHLGS
jgi:hypothetical protein